jgi:phosphopantetheine--protein transferase-like protein
LHAWRKTISLHIGNDIVDLKDRNIRGKSQNIRFVNRVFTSAEKKQIFESPDPDSVLWALWAGKETAYKIISKQHRVSSAPRLYEVRSACPDSRGFLTPETERLEKLDASSSYHKEFVGVVDTPQGVCYIRFFLTCDYVHCIGTALSSEALDAIVWKVVQISPDSETAKDIESTFVREALKKHLAVFCHIKQDDIEIKRENEIHGLGPPLVYVKGMLSDIDVSLSHDGRFGAYAFLLNRA